MTGRGLDVRGIGKSYGETVALEDLSLRVEPGQIFGFVGPNGAGKTTAMRIIVGLLAPDRGEVLWNGSRIDPDHRRRIGYMPEERGLYPKMRVDQQLEYFAELHGTDAATARRRTAEWLERLGIADRAGDNVEELSLGNQQRVQLAASLVFEPDLLILDEPFSGLDPIGVDVLSDVLKEVCESRDVPVIFSSHQLELVERLCDAVAIVKQGRLVAAGPVDELERENSQNLWKARVAGTGEDWDPGLPGVTRRHPWTFELAPDADPQALLARALEAGPVLEFGEIQPGLAELFRTTIGEER
jgi:ABC-2 type transport system ATP-binding protein